MEAAGRSHTGTVAEKGRIAARVEHADMIGMLEKPVEPSGAVRGDLNAVSGIHLAFLAFRPVLTLLSGL